MSHRAWHRVMDETIRLEVRVEDDSVWLTQQQITELFHRDRTVINRHINNVFKEGECDKESNVHFLHIPNSDKPVMYYSLDILRWPDIRCLCTYRKPYKTS